MPIPFSPDTKAEWLKLRKEDVTSTEVSSLFTNPVTQASLSPYMTEYELYYIKVGLAPDTFEENERVVWGKRLEHAIAKGIAEDLDVQIRAVNQYLRHSEEPRMGSSFDFRIVNHPKGPGNLEIKNVDGLIWRNKWGDFEAPDHIELQVQHQMEVADVEWTLICALVGGNEPKFIYRDRDREVGAGLRKAVREFWKKIDAGTPPEPNYLRDAEFIVSLHQSAGAKVLESEDEGLAEALADYTNISKILKKDEDEKKATKARILELIGDDYNKILAGPYTLHCGMVKGAPATVITEDMVGDSYGGRKGYRSFKVYEKEGE
ncbi:MAG: YqaJ viral recombinase family protein [Planctomycetes bacterium]|nr:YqaJ viral recombinase family protein [Planctomycetota bacterium]